MPWKMSTKRRRSLTKIMRSSERSLEKKKKIEVEWRRHGQEMVSLENHLTKKKKESLSEAILRSRHIHIYSLIFLLVFLVLNAYLLGTRILGPIQRFSVYAKRIASGHFSPITPAP